MKRAPSTVPTVRGRITRIALSVLRSDTDLRFLRKKNTPINHGFIVYKIWIKFSDFCLYKSEFFVCIDQRLCPIKEVVTCSNLMVKVSYVTICADNIALMFSSA